MSPLAVPLSICSAPGCWNSAAPAQDEGDQTTGEKEVVREARRVPALRPVVSPPSQQEGPLGSPTGHFGSSLSAFSGGRDEEGEKFCNFSSSK